MAWQRYWTTPYSVTQCSLYGSGYTDECRRLFGFGFSEVHIVIERRVATIYRKEEEQETYTTVIASWMLQDLKRALAIINESMSIADRFLLLVRSDKHDAESYSQFRKLMHDFLPRYITIKWSASGLEDRASPELMAAIEAFVLKTDGIFSIFETFLDGFYAHITSEGKDFALYSALSDPELLHYLTSGELVSESVLRERFDFSIVTFDARETHIVSGKEARTLLSELALEQDVPDTDCLFGKSAYPGKVSGRARIVLRPEEADSVLEGEILITTMTRPEWVTAMKKAAAIVTDTGGLLCHAAIISRELKKPCIIGTVHATRVFKNGDLVEVDADRGAVLKLTSS